MSEELSGSTFRLQTFSSIPGCRTAYLPSSSLRREAKAMKPIHAVLAVVALSIAIPVGLAQQVTGNGTPAFNSFSGGPDLINDGNLNFHFGVPVFARGGRGLPFSLSLPVDNGAWYAYQDIYANWHMGASFSTAQPAGVLAIGTVFHYT